MIGGRPSPPPGNDGVHSKRWTILVLWFETPTESGGSPYSTSVLSTQKQQIVSTLARYGDTLMFLDSRHPAPTSELLRACDIDFIVSFLYGRILSREVVAVPAINIHPSPLPLERGCDPHLWTILDDLQRGVTIHYIDEGIDTGDIITQALLPSPDPSTTTFTQSFEQLLDDCVKLFAETWPSVRARTNSRRPQAGTATRHTLKDQAPLTSLWNKDDLSLPIKQFREKALALLGRSVK